jgi:hypothetical protein
MSQSILVVPACADAASQVNESQASHRSAKRSRSGAPLEVALAVEGERVTCDAAAVIEPTVAAEPAEVASLTPKTKELDGAATPAMPALSDVAVNVPAACEAEEQAVGCEAAEPPLQAFVAVAVAPCEICDTALEEGVAAPVAETALAADTAEAPKPSSEGAVASSPIAPSASAEEDICGDNKAAECAEDVAASSVAATTAPPEEAATEEVPALQITE